MDNRTYFERKDENVVVEEVFVFKLYGGVTLYFGIGYYFALIILINTESHTIL